MPNSLATMAHAIPRVVEAAFEISAELRILTSGRRVGVEFRVAGLGI